MQSFNALGWNSDGEQLIVVQDFLGARVYDEIGGNESAPATSAKPLVELPQGYALPPLQRHPPAGHRFDREGVEVEDEGVTYFQDCTAGSGSGASKASGASILICSSPFVTARASA